jgi:RNA polymerase sigma-70 factor (ECF subfamily)
MDDKLKAQAEFVGLIARHQAALHAYIISLMPGVDGVDDVLQETNLVLWEKRRDFRRGSNFRAWACQIARFKVMSHRRKLAQVQRPSFDEDLAEMLAAEWEAEPEELDPRMEALRKCLGRLQDKERKLIEHRYFSDEPLETFARRHQLSVEGLRVTLFRIRAALKKCITGTMNLENTQS